MKELRLEGEEIPALRPGWQLGRPGWQLGKAGMATGEGWDDNRTGLRWQKVRLKPFGWGGGGVAKTSGRDGRKVPAKVPLSFIIFPFQE